MKTIEQIHSPETRAVVESLATGCPIDPDVLKRIREKAQKIKERVFREQGLVDLGVPTIREFRGELPQ